jgi:hypothetical protein
MDVPFFFLYLLYVRMFLLWRSPRWMKKRSCSGRKKNASLMIFFRRQIETTKIDDCVTIVKVLLRRNKAFFLPIHRFTSIYFN